MATFLSPYIGAAETAHKALSLYKDFDYVVHPHEDLATQCEKLRKEVEFIKVLHEDFNVTNTGSKKHDKGLLKALQHEKNLLRKVLEGLPKEEPQLWQLAKRHQVRTFIRNMDQSMREAREMVNRAIMQSQYKSMQKIMTASSDELGGDEDGDDNEETPDAAQSEREARFEACRDKDPPEFDEITGLNNPRYVLTFENEIFILMDNFIRGYSMEGDEVKRFHQKNLKPFAGDFLGSTLYVSDSLSNCIMMFDKSLNFIKKFGESYIFQPAGIFACEKSNCVYVLTGRIRGSAVVAVFSNDGKYIRQFCHYRLEDPWHITQTAAGNFVISDFKRKAIDVYPADFGKILYSFDTVMADRSDLHCRGMCIDDMGNFYVSLREAGKRHLYESIVVYSQRGQTSKVLEESPATKLLSKNKSLDIIRGLHFYRSRQSEHLLIVDAGNNRLKVIKL